MGGENSPIKANLSDDSGGSTDPSQQSGRNASIDYKGSSKQQKMWGDMSDSEEEEEEEDAHTSNTKKEAVMLKIDTGIQADIHDNEESDPLPTVGVAQKSNTSSTQTNFGLSRPSTNSSYTNTPISNRSRSTESSDASSNLDPRAPSWSPVRGRKWAGSLGEMSSVAMNAPHSRVQDQRKSMMTPEGVDAGVYTVAGAVRSYGSRCKGYCATAVCGACS